MAERLQVGKHAACMHAVPGRIFRLIPRRCGGHLPRVFAQSLTLRYCIQTDTKPFLFRQPPSTRLPSSRPTWKKVGNLNKREIFQREKTSIPFVKRRGCPLFTIAMGIDLQLPTLSTLTPILILQNVLPDRQTIPSISVLFPETGCYQIPNNPFRGSLFKALEETHRMSLSEALDGIRCPFLYLPDTPVTYNGEPLGDSTSTEDFNVAVITLIAAIEHGYYPT